MGDLTARSRRGATSAGPRPQRPFRELRQLQPDVRDVESRKWEAQIWEKGRTSPAGGDSNPLGDGALGKRRSASGFWCVLKNSQGYSLLFRTIPRAAYHLPKPNFEDRILENFQVLPPPRRQTFAKIQQVHNCFTKGSSQLITHTHAPPPRLVQDEICVGTGGI